MRRILISVGEPSGDLHAANLVRELHAIDPKLQFYGMGSVLMQDVGVNLIVNSKNLSIIGLFGIFKQMPEILRAMNTMKKTLFHDRPDLLILVDYPAFNLRLAKIAKKAGVKVLYYISPKIWAWHQSRAKIIQKYVDVMAVIFPFEIDFYKRWQVNAIFVGNPLVAKAHPTMSKSAVKEGLGLNLSGKIIGLFPGSRRSEIERLLPVMIETAELLSRKMANVIFVLPIASSFSEQDLQPYLAKSKVKIHLLKQNIYDVIQICDAIVAASGTVTLEIGLLATPFVLVYKVSYLNYILGKAVIKIPYLGLCNILAGKPITRELIQNDASPEKIAAEITKILTNDVYRTKMIDDLKLLKNCLTSSKQENLVDLIRLLIA